MMPATPDLFLLCLVTFLSLICVGMLTYRQRFKRRKLQQQGVDWLNTLRQLLAHLQQHRGLSSGFLAGDKEAYNKIQGLSREIEIDIERIGEIGHWIHQNSRWQGIVEHWQRLSSHYASLDWDANIRQHNRILANLIYLLEDIADAHQLKNARSAGEDTPPDWHNLLVMAEHIGQARAIGTAITASGHCDSVSRIQMSYLSNKLEITSQQDLPPHTRHKLEELQNCIKDRVMLETPQIDSQIYFKLATGCLEDILGEYDKQILTLKQQLV